jgi:hypothetical protein
LGIEITSYNNWETNQAYIEKNVMKIISVLHTMGDHDSEKLAKQIYTNTTGRAI